MAHPHKHQSKSGQDRAKHRYADGGDVDAGENFPGGYKDAMRTIRPKDNINTVAPSAKGKAQGN